MLAVSVWRHGHRKVLSAPRLPVRLNCLDDGSRRGAVQVEPDRQQNLSSHRHCKHMSDARCWGFETQKQFFGMGCFSRALNNSSKCRSSRTRCDPRANYRTHQSENVVQRCPDRSLGCCPESRELKLRTGLAAEMCEVEPQNPEERIRIVAVHLELLVPIIRIHEPAMHHADNACTTRPSFNGPFSSDLSGAFDRLNLYLTGWVPDFHRPNRLHPRTEVGLFSPSTRSSRELGANHDEIPGPVAMAFQTSSGVPGTSTSASMDRLPDESFLIGMPVYSFVCA